MARVTWWMRVVGVLYLVNGIMMALVRAPIRSAGPEGSLDLAAAGDPIARFLVDTWVGFGLEVMAVGVILLVFARSPQQATPLIWIVIAIELTRGLLYDSYMLVEGYSRAVYLPWLGIHSAVIVTGILALRSGRRAESVAPSPVSM